MTSKKSGQTEPRLPRGRAGKKPLATAKINQATIEEFEREGLGVAAKE